MSYLSHLAERQEEDRLLNYYIDAENRRGVANGEDREFSNPARHSGDVDPSQDRWEAMEREEQTSSVVPGTLVAR